MKKGVLNLACLMVAFILTETSFAQTKPPAIHKDSLIALTQQYYARNIKAFQAGSTVADIDAIFELFTPDFTYVHPQYGGVYSRKRLYNGYINNQKKGRYDGSVADIKVTKMIAGLNAVAVEKMFILKNKETGKLENGDRQMTLFEFKNGKISRIYEYW